MKKLIIILGAIMALFTACDPYEAPDVEIGQLPAAPNFSIEYLPGDSNTVIVKDLSSGNFARVWNFGKNADGKTPNPATSTETIDTVNYLKAGTYTITLYISAENGGGTAQASKTITISQDATVSCDPTIALLTGDCEAAGKCWTFSTAAGAVGVGPTPGDVSWFSSTANGLQAEQYDDSFCFYFDGLSFRYLNNGQTIDPWNGYVPVAYDPPTDHTWTFSPGTGNGGKDQIILTQGSFLGVWDASNVYDIVTLTETQLVVQCEFLNGGGWFTLYFVAL